MRALDIIEAEDPKRFMLHRKDELFAQLGRELKSRGWTMDQNGHLVKDSKVTSCRSSGCSQVKRYEVFVNAGSYLTRRSQAEQPPFVMRITTYHYFISTGQRDRISSEDVLLSSADSVVRHLKMFNMLEAESPKKALRQASSTMRYVKGGNEVDIIDGTGSVIRYSLEYGGVPCIGWINYSRQVPPEAREQVGMRLLNAAYNYAREQREYRIHVSIGTTRSADPRGNAYSWDIEMEDPAEIGNLIQQAKEGVTSASGRRRSITLENVLSLDPGGDVRLDVRPKRARSIWTHRRKDQQGQPAPYRRVRQLPNGRELVMFVAFHKDHAPRELLTQAKDYPSEVAKMAKWAADDIAYAARGEGVNLVVPVPSSKPLALRLARLLASRLGVPYDDPITKTGSISHLPINVRKVLAPSRFSVAGKYRGKTVLIVDDYVVTGASQMATALKLYQAGAKKVVGAALAI